MSWRAFFYREGVLNANQLTAPASDEFDLVRGWQSLHDEHGVALHICVAAALRRGVTDEREAQQLALPATICSRVYLERARRASGSGAYAIGWCSSDETCGFCIFLCAARQRRRQGRPRCLISNLRAHRRYWRVFVGDGVFQLLPEQRHGAVLARDYIATFKLLSLYDIDQCWLCADSARARLGSRDPVGGGCRMPGAGCPARPSA